MTHIPRLQPLSDISLLKTADYQASMFETVRCHPGFGGGNYMVVTLPPTNGMADQGKWCRVNVNLTSNRKFVRVVGFGGPNAASIKKWGKKGVAYYKKIFQKKYKKFYYFGDGINDINPSGDPNTNMYTGLTMQVAEQSCVFVWDGVGNWWTTETNGFGYVIGQEEYQDQSDRPHEILIDIHDKGIAGQNPPTRVLDTEHGLFGAERFALNDQIFFSVSINDYWAGPLSAIGGGERPKIQLYLLCNHGTGGSGNTTFEAKVVAAHKNGLFWSQTPTTKTTVIDTGADTRQTIECTLFDIQEAYDAFVAVYPNDEPSHLMFRVKVTAFGNTRTSIDVLSARLKYQDKMPKVRLFEGVQSYEG